MAIARYLAMTAGEMQQHPAQLCAWMACHFSPYGTGLSNLPAQLPPGALLILNDRTPICGHDPTLIAAQLRERVLRLECRGVLLDFQRPGNGQTMELCQTLCRSLPCPVAVSEAYAQDAPIVFASPVPPDTPPEAALAQWQGREIWLELALDGMEITLTEAGAKAGPLPPWEHPVGGFSEERLHCHYRSELSEDQAVFTLWRTESDADALLEAAQSLGVSLGVGLYQQFRAAKSPLPVGEGD